MAGKRWAQLGASGGLIFVVMQNISQGLIQVGGVEPPFNAPSASIAAFFASRDPRLYGIGDYISALSVVALLWFLGSLWSALRRAGEDSAWLAMVAVLSGLLAAVSLVTGGGWTLARARIDSGLSPEMATYLFDQGNFSFATIWVSLGSMLLAVGVLNAIDRVFPVWLGWSGVVIGAGLIIARAFWATSQLTFVPYLLFWVWMIAISIILMRRAGRQAIG